MRIRNVDFETVMFGVLVSVVLIGLIVIGVFVFGTFAYEQTMMFSCIENGGIWLKNYQVGCTYPHG